MTEQTICKNLEGLLIKNFETKMQAKREKKSDAWKFTES